MQKQNVKHTRTNMMAKTRDEYLTRDRSISVDTCKNTEDVTVQVTLFSPVADRVFDRLSDEERTAWAEEFFNGSDGPLLQNYTLLRHGH
jgi:hypothetical protein